MNTLITVVKLVLLGALIFYIVSTLVAAWCTFSAVFRRSNKKKWARDHVDDVPEKQMMYREGVEWCEKNKGRKTDLHIQNDGLNLYGEYYDFGNKNCVMILLGRSECFYASFYYVKPYIEKGFNVLAMDSRAHGISDGKYHTFGYEESKDYIAWAKYIHDNLGVEHIIFHGICVGASAGLFALTADDCPDYIDGLVGEGMHIRLCETVKNHIRQHKQPVYPVIYLIDLLVRLSTGYTIRKGPIDFISDYHKPLLMLHSSRDIHSLPKHAQQLFDACPSELKRIVMFNSGGHSLVRAFNVEEYDAAIEDFLDMVYADSPAVIGQE